MVTSSRRIHQAIRQWLLLEMARDPPPKDIAESLAEMLAKAGFSIVLSGHIDDDFCEGVLP